MPAILVVGSSQSGVRQGVQIDPSLSIMQHSMKQCLESHTFLPYLNVYLSSQIKTAEAMFMLGGLLDL